MSWLDQYRYWSLTSWAKKFRGDRELVKLEDVRSVGLIHPLGMGWEEKLGSVKQRFEALGKEVITMGTSSEKGWVERLTPNSKSYYIDHSGLNRLGIPKDEQIKPFCSKPLDVLLVLDRTPDYIQWTISAKSKARFRFAPFDESKLAFVDAMIDLKNDWSMDEYVEEVIKQIG
jgi:ribosomal protein L24E